MSSAMSAVSTSTRRAADAEDCIPVRCTSARSASSAATRRNCMRPAMNRSRSTPTSACCDRSSEAPTPGSNLYLMIDARLRKLPKTRSPAAPALRWRSIRATAKCWRWSACRTSVPNLFVNGINHIDYNTLLNAEDRPLLNRAPSGNFLPGSTVKPYVALAGLELGVRKPDRSSRPASSTFPATASAPIAMTCAGAMAVDLREAIAQSVNTYFYGLALEMGIDRSPARWPNSASARDRHRPDRRVVRQAAVARMSAGVTTGLVSRRDGHRRHRPGRVGGHANPARTGGQRRAARGVRHPPHLLHASGRDQHRTAPGADAAARAGLHPQSGELTAVEEA